MSAGYQLSAANTYRYFANRETVTLLDAGGNAQGTVVDAKRLRQNTGERAPSAGKYVAVPVDFRLPTANVVATIMPGWIVVDAASVAYTVQEVDPPSTYNATWNCFCLQLFVVADSVTITLPVDSTDAYSSPITSAGTPVSYQAHIQFEQQVEEVFQGVQFLRNYYRIWVAALNGVAADLPLGAIITATSGEHNGKTFRVIDSNNIDRIDELPAYTCTVDP